MATVTTTDYCPPTSGTFGTMGTAWVTSTTQPLVSAALANVQAEVATAGKSGDNKFDKYSYAKLEDFMAVGKPVLAKHGLSLAIETTEAVTLDDRQTKNGGLEHVVRVRVVATLRHVSGESLSFPCYGEGQDRADKAIYKAMTGAKKYAWAGILAIPTSDDPESDEKVGLSGKGRDKLDSDGNAKTKIPKWTDEQKLKAGTLNKQILDALTLQYGNAAPADEELADWKQRHKYDEPAVVLGKLNAWITELEGRP